MRINESDINYFEDFNGATPEPEVRFAGMKVRKEKRQAMFYMIENCSSCGLDHIIYERDMHTVMNSHEDQLVFICPKDSTCVIVDNEIEPCGCCNGTGEVESNNEEGREVGLTCNGTGR